MTRKQPVRGVGSNQYQVKPPAFRSDPTVPTSGNPHDLIDLEGGPSPWNARELTSVLQLLPAHLPVYINCDPGGGPIVCAIRDCGDGHDDLILHSRPVTPEPWESSVVLNESGPDWVGEPSRSAPAPSNQTPASEEQETSERVSRFHATRELSSGTLSEILSTLPPEAQVSLSNLNEFGPAECVVRRRNDNSDIAYLCGDYPDDLHHGESVAMFDDDGEVHWDETGAFLTPFWP